MLKYLSLVLLFISTTVFAESKIETEKLTKAEINSVLIDHTYPLGGKELKKSKGAMYFSSDGTLELIWEGKRGTGKWKAESKSRFCYSQTLWSGKECITLLRNKTDGGFIHVFEGQTRVLKEGAIEKGNKI
ncbi:MAG: hypothetical protein K0U57_01480 [Alphaproteobacteria bacterium]|jgi:hypothetical protein|nr:hypothetical protein [Alphaproteobacteria bacterium]MDA9224535.1 hypothetical protein [Tateyamaria sp.]